MTNTIIPSPLLRNALLADGLASGGMGAALAAGSGPLAGLLALPQPFLFAVGLVCLGWGGLTFWLGRRERLLRGAAWAVIALNALWVAESALLLALGWLSPNALGTAFVIGQAVVVGALAEAQFIGLRRSEQALLAAA